MRALRVLFTGQGNYLPWASEQVHYIIPGDRCHDRMLFVCKDENIDFLRVRVKNEAVTFLQQIFKKYESLAAQDEVKRQKLLQERAAQEASSNSVQSRLTYFLLVLCLIPL